MLSWVGPPADDAEILQLLPPALSESLKSRNGFLAVLGGFHLRGASLSPDWHSLRAAWKGPNALHRLFPTLRASDIPFAQDCFGDQFLLREREVIHLEAETGTIQNLEMDWAEFMRRAECDPYDFLHLESLLLYREAGGTLEPGQLLSVYPPFVTDGGGASLQPIPAMERIAALADFARQIAGVRDGEQVRIVSR